MAAVCERGQGAPHPGGDRIVKVSSYAPGSISSRDFDEAWADPLNADLNVVRRAAAAFALPNRRGHERLPACPPFTTVPETAVSSSEFGDTVEEIASWSQRQHFDPYFCAGEMVAAFCEVLRRVRRRSGATSSLDLARILQAARAFADRLVFELIDDSNGDHVFAGAHLRELLHIARARIDAGDRDPTLVAVVRALEEEDSEDFD